MNERIQTQVKPAQKSSSFAPSRPGLLQRKCACGGTPGPDGECAECRSKRLTLQRRTLDQAGPSEPPPIVHEVLRSPGQPLDPTTRAFMEPRFGHDFSRVRVHTDEKAAESARAVGAAAYTIGRDVVFGTEQYQPATRAGRRLLAHELTHVVQQGDSRPASGDNLTVEAPDSGSEREAEENAARISKGQRPLASSSSPLAGRNFIQRSPDKPTEAERRRDQRIEELAKWPSNAHDAWKQLNAVDRNLVVLQMASKYGVPFAREFLNAVATWRPQDNVMYYFGRGVGPKREKLLAAGYRLAQKDSVHEWWVLPSGKSVTRNYTEDKPSPAASEEKKEQPSPPQQQQPRPPVKQQPRSARCQDVEFLAQHICYNSERICEIAKEVDDEESRASCERSRKTCKEANDLSTVCITEEER